MLGPALGCLAANRGAYKALATLTKLLIRLVGVELGTILGGAGIMTDGVEIKPEDENPDGNSPGMLPIIGFIVADVEEDGVEEGCRRGVEEDRISGEGDLLAAAAFSSLSVSFARVTERKL